MRCQNMLFPAICSFLDNVLPLEKKIVKHTDLILKSEKYAKPHNKTPINISTHFDKMIFTFFLQSSIQSYTGAIPFHYKTYYLLIYHQGVSHFRTRAVIIRSSMSLFSFLNVAQDQLGQPMYIRRLVLKHCFICNIKNVWTQLTSSYILISARSSLLAYLNGIRSQT